MVYSFFQTFLVTIVEIKQIVSIGFFLLSLGDKVSHCISGSSETVIPRSLWPINSEPPAPTSYRIFLRIGGNTFRAE